MKLNRNLKFKCDLTGCRLALNNLEKGLLKTSELPDAVQKVHERIIEPQVKLNLRKSMQETSGRGTRNIDHPEYGKATPKLMANITSHSGRQSGLIVFGGTGRIPEMDRRDPLVLKASTRKLSSKEVRLWRILEFGSKEHTIFARDPLKSKLIFKGSRTWFWKWFKKESVSHPGTQPAYYFAKTVSQVMYSTSSQYGRYLSFTISNIFRRFSYGN